MWTTLDNRRRSHVVTAAFPYELLSSVQTLPCLRKSYRCHSNTAATMALAFDFQIRSRCLAFVSGKFIAYFLVLVEALQARFLNGTDMHKHIGTAIIGLDEAITFGWIEPFYCTCRHRNTLNRFVNHLPQRAAYEVREKPGKSTFVRVSLPFARPSRKTTAPDILRASNISDGNVTKAGIAQEFG